MPANYKPVTLTVAAYVLAPVAVSVAVSRFVRCAWLLPLALAGGLGVLPMASAADAAASAAVAVHPETGLPEAAQTPETPAVPDGVQGSEGKTDTTGSKPKTGKTDSGLDAPVAGNPAKAAKPAHTAKAAEAAEPDDAAPVQPWQLGQAANHQATAQPPGVRPTGDALLPIGEVHYGTHWPFVQSQAELACTPSGAELIRFADGAVYSLTWPREGYALLPAHERRMDATGLQPRSVYPVLRDAINHCCVQQGMPTPEAQDMAKHKADQAQANAQVQQQAQAGHAPDALDTPQPAQAPWVRQACYNQWDIAHAKGWAALGVNPLGGVFDASNTHAFSYQSWPFVRVVERAAYAWPFKWRDFYLTCTEQGAVMLGTRIDWRLGHVQQGGNLQVVWLGGADLPEALQPHAVPLRYILRRGEKVAAMQQALLAIGQHFCPRLPLDGHAAHAVSAMPVPVEQMPAPAPR